MTSTQNKKIGQFIRETIAAAALYAEDDDTIIKAEYRSIETMLRMMHRASLMHPSTYIMFMKVLTDAVNAAERARKENENK